MWQLQCRADPAQLIQTPMLEKLRGVSAALLLVAAAGR
jgi:hypothetical protein